MSEERHDIPLTTDEIDARLLAVPNKQDKLTVNESAGVAKVVIDGKTYAIPGISELVTPATPTKTTGGSDTDASRSVTLACATSGVTIHYTLDGTTPTEQSPAYSSALTISASTSSETTTTTITAIAFKNGEASSALTFDVKTARHLAKPTISVGGTNYDASRSVTITGTTGASFVDENGSSVTSPLTLTASATVKVKQTLSGWRDSEFSEVSVTVGSPKCYFGFLASSAITTLSQVQSLANSEGTTKFSGTKTATATENSYLWFCVPSSQTISKVTSSGYDVTMESATTSVSGYKCYRSSKQIVAGTYTYVVS